MTQRVWGDQNVQIAHVQNSTITVSFDSKPHRLVPLEPAWIVLPASVTSRPSAVGSLWRGAVSAPG